MLLLYLLESGALWLALLSGGQTMAAEVWETERPQPDVQHCTLGFFYFSV